ncbi:MAG: putative baseplate assembly protein [Haloarculaceae archaeon]
MGLEVPDLDDTDYAELVDEATKLLPAYSDEWTNYNPQDPGITIIELLAWLSDSYVYQLDSVTDAHRRKYLRLMGTRPRPPQPATARLSLGTPPADGPLEVPAGTRLTVVDGSSQEKTFEIDRAVPVTGATVATVRTVTDSGPSDHSHANDTEGMYYRPLGGDPAPGDALALGVDGDPFAAGEECAIHVDVHDEDLPEPGSHGGESSVFEPSVDLVWEYCTDYDEPAGSWEAFPVTRDETDGFYRGGIVALEAPEEWSPADWGHEEAGLFGAEAGLVWIRCRLAEPGYEIPPRFDAVRLDVVTVTNRRTVEGEPLQPVGDAEGEARFSNQTYRFSHAPVLDAEVTVDGEAWTEVPDFDASGPTDTHYVLDPTSGTIRFGDGQRGAVPDPDARVLAERYVASDGADGNVPAGATWRFAEDATAAEGTTLEDVSVTPDGGASGGTDAESLEAAFRRVRRDLKTPYRAVSADDMAALARGTPGLRVARATVLMQDREGAHPDAPPEAQVVVVPYAPPTVRTPTPSRGFLEAVQAHLDEHRLLTDRVRAVEPTYVGLGVALEVQSTEWRPRPGGEDDVAAAIGDYLHPVHGFEGDGWPFGRTLYAEDLAAVVEELPWVAGVESLSITAPGNARVDPDGNVRIDEAALFTVASLDADVVAGSRPAGGDDGDGGRW